MVIVNLIDILSQQGAENQDLIFCHHCVTKNTVTIRNCGVYYSHRWAYSFCVKEWEKNWEKFSTPTLLWI